MFTLEQAQEFVKNIVSQNKYKNEPKGLYEPIEYVLSNGGKRLRPVICVMAFNLFSDDFEKVIPPAMGVEVFHNFTLLHDDIMDKAFFRRNKPTVHQKWNDNTAILSGDAMMVEAYKQLLKYKGENFREILEVFTQTALEVCEGQQFDMNFETQQIVTEQEYLKMIELKTAVLIAGSLKIGALAANSSIEDANNLYQYGYNVGMAFQIKDDYLDVFGDFNVFGKKIGGDIISNKKTFLLISALKIAKGEILQTLNSTLLNKNISEETKIEIITNIYKKLEIDIITQNKIAYFLNKALLYLEKINVESAKKEELKKFAISLSDRNN
jgi:geranylgeranyl diphosphate synthase type II